MTGRAPRTVLGAAGLPRAEDSRRSNRAPRAHWAVVLGELFVNLMASERHSQADFAVMETLTRAR
jgi:hypothetical protein